MDWTTAAVIIAMVFAIMVVLATTYIAGRSSKK
jgi:hypothetical protein